MLSIGDDLYALVHEVRKQAEYFSTHGADTVVGRTGATRIA